MSMTETLAPHLPYLRRYARVLTGSQNTGDSYVRAVLTALLAGSSALDAKLPAKVGLYRLFHAIWISSTHDAPSNMPANDGDGDVGVEERLRSLSIADRAALLLTAVEGFTVRETALILDEPTQEVEQLIVETQHAIEKQLVTKVLIIEDEAVIAIELEHIVSKLGHEVVGTATTRDEAVQLAHTHKPGIVLADINLGEGGSGIDAATEILRSFNIPVIFITAYPERLLTGERPEPTYLITKPFLVETVEATIGQALFFHSIK